MIACEFENGNKASLRHVTVDALVVRDNQLLMVKRAAHLLGADMWALVGGYLERDESMFDAMAREILEETGYETTGVELFRINSRPDRKGEDRQNFDAVFVVSVGDLVGEPDDESSAIQWFDLADLPAPDTIAFDHAENIELYRGWLATPTPLPLID